MTSSSAWRSPLSILMGARRNDDIDLELRDDYFRPSQSSPPLAAPRPRTPAKEDAGPRPSSYNPFSYFRTTSPARVLAAADVTPGNKTGNNADIEGGGSPAPPLGAFPPPISADSPGYDEGGHGEENVADEREDQDADHEFVSSHPWFNQVSLTEPSNNENNSPINELNDLPLISKTIDRASKRLLSWEDQKAIIGTTFNFANSIIGAGAMGLGGAFAASGGGISVICLIGFAFLTKESLDLVIDLSSCSSVITKARSQDRWNERSVRENDIDVSSSIADSESSCEESETDGELSAMLVEIQRERNVPDEDDDMFDELMEGYNIKDDDKPDQGGSPKNNETTNEEEEAEGESSQHALSPLMASPEEGQNESDEIGDKFHTPTKRTGLGMDHPLMNSPGRLIERERYDSLALDAAQPKFFSPSLQLVKSTPSIQIDTPLQQPQGNMSPCTYEELGRAAFGTTGRFSVLISKALYSLGCLVAYVVVVRDNFGLALRRIIMGPTPNFGEGSRGGWLSDDDYLAFWVSAIFMLPLSCPRTMKPLAKFSFISILSISFLIIAVVYLFFTCTNPDGEVAKSTFYADWIQIRSLSGFIQSLGCFIFTFVCHHTANNAYETLPPPIRNPRIWRRVSTNSIFLALQASLAIGVFAYLTFGSQTPADVLMGYPTDLTLANIARLLLCLTMVLTFPLPFLTCREMTILIFIDMHKVYHINLLGRFTPIPGCDTGASPVWARLHNGNQHQHIIRGIGSSETEEQEGFVQMYHPSFFKRWNLFGRGFRNRNVGFTETNEEWLDDFNGDGAAVTEALLSGEEHEADFITSIGGQRGKAINPSPLSSRSAEVSSSETTILSIQVPTPSWILPNGDGRQLSLFWHAALTFTIWLTVTLGAIKSPSLGDVLDLVGAFTGTLLAFVLPALFSFKLKGYSHLSLAILGIGGAVGLLGTIFSFVKFTKDTK